MPKKKSVPERPELKFEDLKVGRCYRGKKPKVCGFMNPVADDRQILYISSAKVFIESKEHGYHQDYLDWLKVYNAGRKYFPLSPYDYDAQKEYNKQTGKEALNVEIVTDYKVQYESPSVKMGKHYPSIPASKFLKWASHDVTDELPENGWAEWDLKTRQPKKHEQREQAKEKV